MPTAFIPFTMCATVRDDHRRSFRTDLERLTSAHRGWAPLDVLKSTNTKALLRGAIPQGVHTATDAGLARYLQDRLAADTDIHLDLTVSIER
ncbi:hypothetical protein ARGLB_037_01880 [Arthrobacter globiformis NBRC 12137]|uniref:Uncharacterized protein n=1 Tax=Arthrobacter globiformis (strain ATCC 8010 / DSM 20124 / JCM 1332 / NBRC 12137 / NCIMB 8907 / NRRL B-2979 / 168) TaxID=1077972 RepID=H0QK97_ARTG1|nr:hypothetical protein [Arthrobacter globiformis]GAB13337.1 hypothetical protein ARGLB_037_01880 [Arthrobacter globiformis NBRC 12137]